MISVDEAQEAVLTRVRTLAAEKTALGQADSRVLRAPVVADRDQPPFNRAAMDGFAVRSLDARVPKARLRVVGEVRAGVWPERPVDEGEAMKIMTGAPVPEGADAVVQIERTRLLGADVDAASEVELETAVQAGQNIVPRGSEAVRGAVLLSEGIRIGSAQFAVLAATGTVAPLVSRVPRVALLVTGDEVIEPAGNPEAAQIRNANGPSLCAALRRAGCLPIDGGIVPDDPVRTREAIERALAVGPDALILSGGVSAGDFDFVEEVLGALGTTLHVTAVRVKPGAPFVFGTRGDTLVFGLPGNPVSAQVTFELFVRPALLKMQGAACFQRPLLEAVLEGALTNRSARRNYLPVTVSRIGRGLRARPVVTQGSGDVAAHARADALAILEPDIQALAAGDSVMLYPLSSFLEA